MSHAGNASPAQLVVGALLAVVIAAAARRGHALSASGAIAAFVVGTLIFGFGGRAGAVPLLTFFATSTLLSRWRKSAKQALGYEKGAERDSGQVFANGGVASLIIVAAQLAPPEWRHRLSLGFVAALAAANADTWATEIGSAIGGQPISLSTFRRVPAGSSGAISLAGTAALAVGAIVVAASAAPFGLPLSQIWIPSAAGIVGALADSIFGATLQAQWADPNDPERMTELAPAGRQPVRGLSIVGNDCVNFLCTLTAALAAICIARQY